MAPHTRFQLETKTWPQLVEHVRYWRQRTRRSIASSNWSQITVLSSSNDRERDGARIYALGATSAVSGHQTLLAVDIVFDDRDDDHVVDKYWIELLRDDAHLQQIQLAQGERYQLSREEEALHERLRANVVHGVTSYTIDECTRRLLFMSSSRLFSCVDSIAIRSSVCVCRLHQ